MRLNKLFFLGALLLMVSVAFVGCRKKGDTIVKILVRDSGNQAVVGATVTLDAVPGDPNGPTFIKLDVFPFTSTSNSAGEAVFNLNELYELGQAGVAVLEIKASAGTGTATGVVKVVEETETEETIFI